MIVLDARGRRRIAKSPSAICGALIVAALLLFAAAAPLLSSHGPNESRFDDALTPALTPTGPSARFLFGADRLFRDELVRVAYGARLSLTIGVAATAIAMSLGAVVGIIAGYWHGTRVRAPWVAWAFGAIAIAAALRDAGRLGVTALIAAIASLFLPSLIASTSSGARAGRLARALSSGPRIDLDGLLMRLVDIGLSFPFLLLVMAIAAAASRLTLATVFVTLGVTGWLGVARVLRAKTMQVKNADFIVAARALGQSTPRILVRHVLPNVIGPLIVIATISVGQMILAESVLSYLGAGVTPPTPTWGRMLFEGQDYFQAAPWLVAAPGVAIVLAVIGFNLLGEGLRDALDPS